MSTKTVNKIPDTYVDHVRCGNAPFEALALRESCQNLEDNRPSAGVPEILLSACTSPFDRSCENVVCATNAKPFSDAETMKGLLFHGISGAGSGYQGSGIFAAGLMWAGGDLDYLDITYLSRGADGFFGARLVGVRPNIAETSVLSQAEVDAWMAHLKKLYVSDLAAERKRRGSDAGSYVSRKESAGNFYDSTNVWGIFRFKRRTAKTKTSDTSPVSIVNVGLLMELSTAAQNARVFFTPSTVFGSELYEHRLSKDADHNVGIFPAFPPSHYMPDISDKDFEIPVAGVPIVVDEINNIVEYWDVMFRFKRVKYLLSGATSGYKTCGKNALAQHHYARPAAVGVTLRINDPAFGCVRKQTDPIFIDQVSQRDASCFAENLGFCKARVSEHHKPGHPDVIPALEKMGKFMGVTVADLKPTDKSKDETRARVLLVYTQVEVVATPQRSNQYAPGGIWLDFYANNPDNTRKFLRDAAAELVKREGSAGHFAEMAEFRAFRDECNKDITDVMGIAEGLPPYMDWDLRKKVAKLQVYPVTLTEDANGDITDVVVSVAPVPVVKTAYGVPRNIKVVLRDSKGGEIDPRELQIVSDGVQLDCSMTEAVYTKFKIKMATLVIAPLSVKCKGQKPFAPKSAADFIDAVEKSGSKKVTYSPHADIRAAGVDNTMVTLGCKIDVPVVGGIGGGGKSLTRKTKGDGGTAKPKTYTGSHYADVDDVSAIVGFDAGQCKLNRKHVHISQLDGFDENKNPGNTLLGRDFRHRAHDLCVVLSKIKKDVDSNLTVSVVNAAKDKIADKYGDSGEAGLKYVIDMIAQEMYRTSLQGVVEKMIDRIKGVVADPAGEDLPAVGG